MIVKCILLALSASIDALGLGITYGIKKTKMSSVGNLIIFVVLFCLSGISVFIGHYISVLFSPIAAALLGSSLLIVLGVYNIFKAQTKNCSTNFDTDGSNYIDAKEAFILGLAVAVDASCVSLGSGMIGIGGVILPFLMAVFHTFFVNCGNLVANNIVQKFTISSKLLSNLSGIILIFIGFFRLLA